MPAVDPGSVRPVMRRAEEKTVYTGRRALVRNSAAVLLSAGLVAALLFMAIHWRDRGPKDAPSAASPGSPVSAEAPPSALDAPGLAESSAPLAAPALVTGVTAAVQAAASVPPAGVSSAASHVGAHHAGAPAKRARPMGSSSAASPASAAPAAPASLDDLNQTIRH